MKQRILSAFLAVVMVISLLPMSVFAADTIPSYVPTNGGSVQSSGVTIKEPHIHDNLTFLEWTETSGTVSTSGNYYLADNITATGNITICSKVVINLCLNGKKLNLNGHTIEVKEGATLNICDCQSTETEGHIDSSSGLWKPGSGEKTANLVGGVIYGSTASAVKIKRATFNMSGGNIAGNTGDLGGGVLVDADATFNMSGGSILYNSAYYGGGVFQSSTMNITGEVDIRDNKAAEWGNNLYLVGNKIVTVSAKPKNPIGISTYTLDEESSPADVTSENSSDISSYFFSDRAGYRLVNGENNVVQLEYGSTHTHSDGQRYEAISKSNFENMGGGQVAIYGDFVCLDENLIATQDIIINATALCLNGYTFDLGNYTLFGSRNITICDCCKNPGKITSENSSKIKNHGILTIADGAQIIGDVTITNGLDRTLNITGGVINLTETANIDNEGTLNMSGGSVTGIEYGIKNTGTIYLSGSPSISGGADYSDLCNNTGKIYAQSSDGTTAYTGEPLRLEVNSPSNGKVAVYNADIDSFSLVNTDGYILAANNGNLILAIPHTHSWATDWTSNATHHWHECMADDCDITADSQKDGYGTHTSENDDGNCTTAVKCKKCNYETKAAKPNHTTVKEENKATYTKKPICDECGKEYGDVIPDTTKPTGKIKIGENGWFKFWNTVSFGLFCKNYVEIEITGEDAETAVKSIEYYLSDTAINDEDIKGITAWTAYTDKVRIDAERKVFVYAKITDNSDNVTYLSVDGGIVIYTDAEAVTTQTRYIATSNRTVEVEVLLGGNTVKSVSNGDYTLVEGTDYTVNDNKIILNGSYLETLSVETHTFTVSYNPLGETYVEAKGNEAPQSTEFSIRVAKRRLHVSEDEREFTYNGQEQTYEIEESEFYTVSGNKQTDAGKYTVTVAIKEEYKDKVIWDNNTTNVLKFEFNIAKATFTANVEQLESLTYNGGEQSATVKAKENGVKGGMTVTYKYGLSENACDSDLVPEFKDADEYTVYFVASAENHNDVKGSFTVKIDKKDLNVTANNHTVTYGDEPSHDNVSYDGFVLNETAVVLNGTLGFDYNYQKGDDIGSNYTITPKGLTSNNYNIIFKNGMLTVTPLLIDFDWKALSPEDLVYDGNDKNIGTTVKNQVTSGQYDIWLFLEYHGDTKNVTEEGFYAQIKDTAGEKAYNYDVDTSAKSPVYKITKATPETSFPTGLNIDTDKKLSDIDLTGFDGYTWDAPDTAVKYGVHEYSMTFTPADTVNYNTVSKMIKVTGGDITAPTAEITLKDNKWNEFLNNITFGLFFKETQSITITAADTESGIKEIAYCLATEELSKDDVKALDNSRWTVYSDTFAIEPDNKYAVYARITDNAGNIIYINSEGIVLDSIKPVISGVEDGKDVYGDAAFTVDEDNLDTVTLDGEPVEVKDGKYTVPADNKEHTIVVKDKAGNEVTYKLTVYKNYKVSFVVDGKEISATEVGYGKDAALPRIPAKDGYTAKWDTDGKNITADTTITAVYEKIPQSPQTGDNSNIWLWVAVMFVSGLAIFGLTVNKKRKSNKV